MGSDMGGQNLSDQEGEGGRLDPPADSHWPVFLPRQTPSPFPGQPGELCIRDTASPWDWISRCDAENRACPAELAKGLRDGDPVTPEDKDGPSPDGSCRDLVSFLFFPLVLLHHLCDAIWVRTSSSEDLPGGLTLNSSPRCCTLCNPPRLTEAAHGTRSLLSPVS